jgi:hypothetical protein
MRTLVGGVLGRLPRPTPAMAVALLALLIAASGAAVAAIPSGDGTITACYDKRSGALRVIDAASQACASKETQLTWKSGLAGSTVANAANADKLDNKDSTEFLGANQTAADSDKLDGIDSTAFALANHQHSTQIKAFGGSLDPNFVAEFERNKWVGSPASVTITSSSQRITASGEAPLGSRSDPNLTASPYPLAYDICYDPPTGGGPLTFTGFDTSTAEISTVRTPLAAFGTQSGFSPGTYNVGICVRSASLGTMLLDDSGIVHGWVMVTND